MLNEAARVAALDESGLPEDIFAALQNYKATWAGLSKAIQSGQGDEKCAALAAQADASGREIREAMARRGFVDVGL